MCADIREMYDLMPVIRYKGDPPLYKKKEDEVVTEGYVEHCSCDTPFFRIGAPNTHSY